MTLVLGLRPVDVLRSVSGLHSHDATVRLREHRHDMTAAQLRPPQRPPLAAARMRLTWILLAVLAPLAWGILATTAGPSDGTVVYPSMSWSSSRHWDAAGRPGIPLADTLGSGALSELSHPIRVVAVADASGRLVPLSTWASHPPATTHRMGDRVRYRVVDQAGARHDVLVELAPFPWSAAVTSNLGTLPLAAALLTAGPYVFWRRPRDLAARALLSLSAFVPAGMTAFPLGLQVIDIAGGRGLWPFVVGDLFNALAWGSMILFALVFPRPVPLLERRPWLNLAPHAFVLLLYGAWWVASGVLYEGTLPVLEAQLAVSAPASKVALLIMAGVLAWSYRHTDVSEQRLAIRLVLSGVLVAGLLYLGLGQLPDAVLGAPLVPFQYLALALLLPLLALVAAVLRYRMFELDVLIRRSLLFAAVVMLVAGSFMALAYASAGLLARALSGGTQGRATFVAVMISGAVLMLLLSLVGLLLRRSLGRLAFGDREDPSKVVRQLQGVGAENSYNEALREVVETLVRTLRLAYAAIEVAETEDDSPLGVRFGCTHREPTVIQLSSGGRVLGRLLLDTGRGSEPLGPADERLLDAVGAQVAALLQALRSNAELRRSRERLITAREEERRRLRRDLHDGLGPALATRSMQLEVARELLKVDAVAADSVLEKVAESTSTDIAEIRRLVDDLRPPVLDQLGLVSALQQRAENWHLVGDRRSFRCVVVGGADVEPLPAAVEVAAYRISVEAVNNAARHSQATSCRVSIFRDRATLLIEIADDGTGMPDPVPPGVGIVSMRERAEELGGRFDLNSSERGTTIAVQLPLPNDRIV